MLLLLSSCASARWTKPAAATQDLEHDEVQCESEAEHSYPLMNAFALRMQEKVFAQCMQQKGWTETN